MIGTADAKRSRLLKRPIAVAAAVAFMSLGILSIPAAGTYKQISSPNNQNFFPGYVTEAASVHFTSMDSHTNSDSTTTSRVMPQLKDSNLARESRFGIGLVIMGFLFGLVAIAFGAFVLAASGNQPYSATQSHFSVEKKS